MKNDLLLKKCAPCEGSEKPLTKDQYQQYLDAIPDWTVKEEKELVRTFICKDFISAVVFINKIGAIAEAEGHHPDIYLHDYKKVDIILSTHAIDGLSINDFILAAKVEVLYIAK